MAASPGKFGSANIWLLVDGYNLITTKLKSLSYKVAALNEDSTGVGDTVFEKTPTGVSEISVQQGQGFFDTATNGGHAALKDVATSPQATPRIACFGFAGHTIGEAFTGIEGHFNEEYEVLGQVPNLTKANAKSVVSGQRDEGTIVQPLATKTGDWNTKTDGTVVDYALDTRQQVIPITSATKANPCVVTTTVPHGLSTGHIVLTSGNTLAGPSINSEQTVTVISATTFSVAVNTSGSSGAGTGGSFVRCNSLAGGVGYQQVTALSGFSGYVGKLRDSADDSTYADLIEFADVTAAPGKERKTVAGTIDRYVCHDGNVTGSGSITAFSGLCRN